MNAKDLINLIEGKTVTIEGRYKKRNTATGLPPNERVVYIDGKFLDPYPSQKVVNHSPTGFNWGYAGSGPSQLALAILLELRPDIAKQLYQKFKEQYITKLSQDKDFKFTIDIDQWVENNK